MKNTKNIIVSGIVAMVLVGGGIFYYRAPQYINSMFSSASVSEEVVSDSADVSSTDITISTSSDASSVDQSIISQENSDIPSVKKKASAKIKNAVKDVALKEAAIASEASSTNISSNDISVVGNNNDSPQNISTTTCSLPSVASSALTRKIIFNEIAWMGAASSSSAEWLEIKNISGSLVDLSGWELVNASGKIKILFSSADDIPAGGLLLLSRNSSSSRSYSGTLSNGGDVLVLMDAECNVSDLIDASSGWPAGNNATKQTLERDADGIGWHTSVASGGTPGAENSTITPPIPKTAPASAGNNNSVVVLDTTQTQTVARAGTSTDELATSTASSTQDFSTTTASVPTTTISSTIAHVLISEVQISGASSTNDFIKLYNPSDNTVSIAEWKLHKRSQTGTEYSLKQFPGGTVIAAGHSFIWANAANGFSELIGANISSTETLSADNSIALLDASGTVIDALAWGSGTGQFGEGPPVSTNPVAGQVIMRKSENEMLLDTANNSNDFIVQ